jgi:hypothetical protein
MNWTFHKGRKEWYCEHGVGHYDPQLSNIDVHGCDGCCGRDDFPGKPNTNEGLETQNE